VGGVLGYFLGAVLACEVFRQGNLCGLYGVFIAGPLGLVAGGVAAGWFGEKRLRA
jgi:hypothetical protein